MRAPVGDWLRFVLGSREQGISQDEIRFSGIAHALATNHGQHDVLTQRTVGPKPRCPFPANSTRSGACLGYGLNQGTS
jgi:hypothetical protein